MLTEAEAVIGTDEWAVLADAIVALDRPPRWGILGMPLRWFVASCALCGPLAAPRWSMSCALSENPWSPGTRP